MSHPNEHPCLLFALNREAAPFLRGVVKRPVAGSPCPAFLCGQPGRHLVVLETGVGASAVQTAFDWLLGQPTVDGAAYRPGLILSAGFSGALSATLAVGDVILASSVMDAAGNHWPASWPDAARPTSLRRGRLWCSDRFIGDVAEKLALGEARQALAVDMESAVIARICQQLGLPFGCLRVISDDVHVPLDAAIFELIEGERISYRRLAWLLFRSPRLVGQLLRLARQTRLAAARLTQELNTLLLNP